MEPNLNLYFREIVYHNPLGKKDSVCGASSYEALNVEEGKLGNLYLAGKISNFPPKKHKNSEFLLSVLTSVIKREFYSRPQKDTLEALESALQSANIYLEDFARKGHKEWIGNLDFACLVFSQNIIHISQAGNMIFYLYRKGTMSNVAKKFLNNNDKSKSLKIFSNIASGDLEENDKIIIASADLLEIIPVLKIKELISYPSTEQLYEFIKGKLKDKKTAPNSLACLILEAKTKAPFVEKKILPLKKIPEQAGINLEKILNSKIEKTPLIKYNIPVCLIALLVFFSIILAPYLAQKIGYEIKISKIDNFIVRAKEIINRSELALVYQNQPEAQAFLQQANNLLANANFLLSQLPERVQEEPEKEFQSVQQGLNIQKNSINNVINISQPEEIADLAKNTFTFAPNGILKLENYLFLYEITSGFIYKINLDDLNNPTLIFLSSKDTFKLGTLKENAIILLSDPEKIYIYDKNDHYDTYLLKPNLESTLYIKDMTNYSDNLYFLNTEKLDILKYKYAPEESSLNGSSWLNEKSKEDLIDAQSIAIDGSVFVSKADGRIIEFIQGRKVREFKPDVSPEFNKGHQIFTQPDMKNLYLLDPQFNRIISINKQDNMAIQYVSNYFDSLTDFWITPDEKTIYILNGLKVFRIDI